MTEVEIILLSGLLWLPLGIAVGSISERYRGHVRDSPQMDDSKS